MTLKTIANPTLFNSPYELPPLFRLGQSKSKAQPKLIIKFALNHYPTHTPTTPTNF